MNCRPTCPGCAPFEEALTVNDSESERGNTPEHNGVGLGFAVGGQRLQVQRPALQWQAADARCELSTVS